MKFSKIAFVTVNQVVKWHEDVVDETGGSQGVRDLGLLESAIVRPWQVVFGYLAHPSVAHMAAALVTGIIQNHPFIDGNKRTGLFAGLAFLDANGFPIPEPSDRWVQVAEDVACHRIDIDELAAKFAAAMGTECPVELDDPDDLANADCDPPAPVTSDQQ
ncbi:MAG: type II toxin-antitoxin system death-on-curing family toxin [Polyangiaceae bacterium]|nr:type II toxin-antitoxin system death-on-curing family toxin [Polyangiaceae bacterium]